MERSLIQGAVILCALLAAACSHEPRVRVGSKNFSEQLMLGEIVAQHLENRLHGHVSRKLDLGGTLLAQQAMVAGDIDVYPEYTGTALTAVLKQKPLKDPAQILAAVRQGYAQWHLEWLDPLGFENTFAMAVRKRRRRVRDALRCRRTARAWKLGAGYEFAHREDGLPGLMQTYGLRLAGGVKTMDLGLLYQALSKHQVDMVAGNSTDGMLCGPADHGPRGRPPLLPALRMRARGARGSRAAIPRPAPGVDGTLRPHLQRNDAPPQL